MRGVTDLRPRVVQAFTGLPGDFFFIRRTRVAIRSGVRRHLHLWTFLAGVALCGLIFGSIVAGQLGQADKLALGNALEHLLVAVQSHQLASGRTLWIQRLISDGEILGLIWLFGVSVIGIPFVIGAIFLRAFSVGFAVGYTTLQFGWKGLALSGIGIFLHQVITLLTLFIAAIAAIRFSQQILAQSLPISHLTLNFLKYTGTFLLCSGGLMLGAFIQAFVVPHLLTSLIA